jgi:transposase
MKGGYHVSYYVGLDLHSNNTCIGILNQDGRRIYKARTQNFIGLILGSLERFRAEVRGVVVESTFNWYWLVDGLMEAGYRVHLANPSAIKPYEGLKHRSDYDDAFYLAELLRLGILPEGYIYPKMERSLRDLLRKRLMLVRHRTALILSFQNLYNREKGCKFPSDHVKRLCEQDVEELFSKPYVRLAAKADIGSIRFLSQRIEEIEKVILSSLRLLPEFERLKTVPGIGDILAMTIALETGDIRRFPQVGNYASYCRCVESRRLSNSKTKGQGNRKNGNKYLGWAFVEAANHARRHCPPARSFVQRKLTKTNKIVALKALAHKLARASYYILRDQVAWSPDKAFGTPS